MSNQYQNPIDALYDEDNNDPIVLYNEHGEEVLFEQVALIPQDKPYVILKPVQPLPGMNEDEALVFAVITHPETQEEDLVLVTDEAIIDRVFDEYDALMEEYEDD